MIFRLALPLATLALGLLASPANAAEPGARVDAKAPVGTSVPASGVRPARVVRHVHRVRRGAYRQAGWYDRPPWHGPGVPLGDLEAYGYRPVPAGLDAIYPTNREVAAPLYGCRCGGGYRARFVGRRVVVPRVVSVRG